MVRHSSAAPSSRTRCEPAPTSLCSAGARPALDLFPDLVKLTGDRDNSDYGSLSTGRWDAVVDLSGYVVRHVDQAMDALDGRVGRYLFVSSHAVYSDVPD